MIIYLFFGVEAGGGDYLLLHLERDLQSKRVSIQAWISNPIDPLSKGKLKFMTSPPQSHVCHLWKLQPEPYSCDCFPVFPILLI